jgi:hypothetical protein
MRTHRLPNGTLIINLQGYTMGEPCTECSVGDGSYCCEIQPENDRCAGAYEGICHAVWVATYGTTPWEDDRSWELTQDLTSVPF